MDAVISALATAAPQLGGLGGIMLLLGLLIRREMQTTERHGIELDRLSRIHDEELAELRAELRAVRGQRDSAEERLRQIWESPRGGSPPRAD